MIRRTKRRKRHILIAAGAILILALTAVIIILAAHHPAPAEPPLIYLQRDPRWAKDIVGNSGQTIHGIGCTLCCLSMALNQLGIDLDPGQLNRALKQNGGYTSRGLLVWDALPKITDNRFRVAMYNNPADADIPAALRAGNPVIVRIIRNRGQHWVLIARRSGSDYLIKDPAGDGQTLDLLNQKYPGGIQSVRIIEKND